MQGVSSREIYVVILVMYVYVPILFAPTRKDWSPYPTEIHALRCSLTSSTTIIHRSSNYLPLDRTKKQPMPAMSSRRALFLLFPLIPLSIAIAIPSSDDFFSTEDFQPSVGSGFNGATTDSNNAVRENSYIALAPTTNYAKTTTSSQDEFGNFDNLRAEQPPPTNQDQDQGLPQAVESGDFIVPGNNQLPTLEQTPPTQLETPQLNTADTEPLPTSNTDICKNPKETIPVCHSMYERTIIPPPLELEMVTTSTRSPLPLIVPLFLLIIYLSRKLINLCEGKHIKRSLLTTI